MAGGFDAGWSDDDGKYSESDDGWISNIAHFAGGLDFEAPCRKYTFTTSGKCQGDRGGRQARKFVARND